MNMAYTEAYLAWQKKCQIVFCQACASSDLETKVKTLSDDWQIRSRYYEGQVENCAIRGSENELLNASGCTQYQWRNLDNDGEFQQMIHHANGEKYLIFRQDLYGYSVLNLETLEDFHYFPEEAFPQEKEKFSETFIWTDVFYSSKNNLLAVIGCFWACPSSVILLDFTDPMVAQEKWLDLHLVVDSTYDLYDDLTFLAWNNDGSLTLQGENNETQAMETFILSSHQLRQALLTV